MRTAAVAVLAALAADICHVSTITTDRLATFLADSRHVLAILTYRFAALAARFTCFLRGKLVRVTALVGRTPALTGDLALPRFVHAGESSPAALSSAIIA